MTVDVKVPQLAESIAEATLLEWKKQPGEHVDQDEVLIELETDKVVLEIPSPEAGTLKEIVKGNGESVQSNDVIARVEPGEAAAESEGPAAEQEEQAAEAPAAEEEKAEEAQAVEAKEGAEEEKAEAADEGRAAAAKLSPAVRKLVEEHDLDPSKIHGTGKGGRLTKGNVLAYLEEQEQEAEEKEPAPKAREGERAPAAERAPVAQKPAAPERKPAEAGERPERRVPLSRIRARIAERLVQAQQTAAILTTFNDVDMGPVMDLRKRYRDAFEKRYGVRLGIMSFFVKAAIQALQRFPAVNAYIEENEIVYHDYCDVGIAVSSPRGLLVPILRNTETLSFAAIEQQIAEFGERAKNGQITLEELTGGTFTISNGGVFGSLLSAPILNPPQSAILGMHRVQERPMAVNGEVVIRPMMYLALSYDHRIIDGREAVLFLVTIKEALEDPGRMLLEI